MHKACLCPHITKWQYKIKMIVVLYCGYNSPENLGFFFSLIYLIGFILQSHDNLDMTGEFEYSLI